MIKFLREKLSINLKNATRYCNVLMVQGLCCIDRIFLAYESDESCLHKLFDEDDAEEIQSFFESYRTKLSKTINMNIDIDITRKLYNRDEIEFSNENRIANIIDGPVTILFDSLMSESDKNSYQISFYCKGNSSWCFGLIPNENIMEKSFLMESASLGYSNAE